MKIAKAVRTPQIFTTYDIGRMTGTDPTTVHKWIDRGLLRGYRTPGGHRRVRGEDLRAFLVAHKMPLPPDLGGPSSLRVLLVDHDAEALRSLARALKRLRPEWEHATSESCVEALLMLSTFAPNVIVFDMGDADVDCFSLCKRLHERAETAGIQLIGVGSRISPEAEKRAKGAGAVACLKKPMSLDELIWTIDRALVLSWPEVRLRRPSARI